MPRPSFPMYRKFPLLGAALLVFAKPLYGEPTGAALSAFAAYARITEARLGHQHQSPETFLTSAVADPGSANARLHQGQFLIDRLTPTGAPIAPGALLHHWRGTAFAPGAKAADFERFLEDVAAYPQRFSPEVLQARVLAANGTHLQAWMRVRQQHVLTVVMDTTYDISFASLDPQHGSSLSRSLQVREIASPGTRAERPLSAAEEHGFLWKQNTYWSYEERDEGLYLQIETLSLSRSLPHGLAWALAPYVESVPRESMEFALRSACNAMKR